MGNPRYANGHARRQVREWLRSQGLPCHICGRAIDYTLPARHPMSFEVDEVVPVSKGGSPYDRANVAPAHRICNERRGNRDLRGPGRGRERPSGGTAAASPRVCRGGQAGASSADVRDVEDALKGGFGPRCCDLTTEDASRF